MRMMIKLALHKRDFAGGKIIDGADHTNLIPGDHFGQDWLRVLQALGVVAHVGDNGALLQIVAGLLQHRLDAGLHRPHEIRNMAWQRVSLLKRRHRCIDRAAAVVAEHHDQLCAEHGGAKTRGLPTHRA